MEAHRAWRTRESESSSGAEDQRKQKPRESSQSRKTWNGSPKSTASVENAKAQRERRENRRQKPREHKLVIMD